MRVSSVLRRSCCVVTVQRCPADLHKYRSQHVLLFRRKCDQPPQRVVPGHERTILQSPAAMPCVGDTGAVALPPRARRFLIGCCLSRHSFSFSHMRCVEVKCLGSAQQLLYAASSASSPFPVVGHAWEGAWGAKGGPGALRLRPSTLRAVAGNSTVLERGLAYRNNMTCWRNLARAKTLRPLGATHTRLLDGRARYWDYLQPGLATQHGIAVPDVGTANHAIYKKINPHGRKQTHLCLSPAPRARSQAARGRDRAKHVKHAASTRRYALPTAAAVLS